jgi:hypothetical protein
MLRLPTRIRRARASLVQPSTRWPPIGDMAQLLVVLVHEGTWMAGNVADRCHGHPIGVAEPSSRSAGLGPGGRSRPDDPALDRAGPGRIASWRERPGSRPRSPAPSLAVNDVAVTGGPRGGLGLRLDTGEPTRTPSPA